MNNQEETSEKPPDYSQWTSIDDNDSDVDWNSDTFVLPVVDIRRPATPEQKSIWVEVPQSVRTLKSFFPEFKSSHVLQMEHLGMSKEVAFIVIDFLIPDKLGELIAMRLWESVSNSIADTGFYELLRYYLLNLDVFHRKCINNRRNLLKAIEDRDVELLNIMIAKYHERAQFANHFHMNSGSSSIPNRSPDEFDVEMCIALEAAACSGFFEGMKVIDRLYFGSYKTVIGRALDATHKNADMISFILSKYR